MKLKKIGLALLTAVFTLAMATAAFAQSTEIKEADVELKITQMVEVIKEGESVDLEALTMKKGSSYNVTWSVLGLTTNGDTDAVNPEDYTLDDYGYTLEALPVEGTDELADTYVAKAKFTGKKAGTYQITAAVTMKAGKSHVSWVGEDSKDVKVEAALKVVGLLAKTTKVEAEKNNQGKVTGYNVTYDVYVKHEDGTEKLLTEGATTNLGASGNAKKVEISYEGQTYSVTVSKD